VPALLARGYDARTQPAWPLPGISFSRRRSGAMRPFPVVLSLVLVSAGAAAFAFGGGGSGGSDPAEPPPPVNTVFAGVLVRIGLGADALAAAEIGRGHVWTP